jgi:hypothetical protein
MRLHATDDDDGSSEPDNYDFEGTRAIAMLDGSENQATDSDEVSGEKREKMSSDFEDGLRPTEVVHRDPPIDHDSMLKVFKRAAWYSSAMSLIVILISE